MQSISTNEKQVILAEIFTLISEQEQSLREILTMDKEREYALRANRINDLLKEVGETIHATPSAFISKP